MLETSKTAVQLLRALALAVRSEQDFGLAPHVITIVGALKWDAEPPSDAMAVKHARGYANLPSAHGYEPLRLRGALNKIAHADPHSADYYVAPMDLAHELLLYGKDRGRSWFAAVSILDLVQAIKALPDAAIASQNSQ